MEILRAFRFRIRPTGHQKTLFGQNCGVARSAWNWGVKACRQEYEQAVEDAKNDDDFVEKTGRKGTVYKKWNTAGRMPICSPDKTGWKKGDGNLQSFGGRLYAAYLKEHQLGRDDKMAALKDPASHPYPWLLVAYSHVYSYALKYLVKSYGAFWKGLKEGRSRGRPLIKSRKPIGKRARKKWGVRQERNPSFGLQIQKDRNLVQAQPTCSECGHKSKRLELITCEHCGHVKRAYIVLPAMFGFGPLRVWDDLGKMKGRPVMATIRQEADSWYISISCKIEIEPPAPRGEVIGVDLGVNSIMTLWSQFPLDVASLERRLTGLTETQERLLADVDAAYIRAERISELSRRWGSSVLEMGDKEIAELKSLDAIRRHREVVRRCKARVHDAITVTTEEEGTLVELKPPLPLERKQRKLARLQRALKRKERDSKRKARNELQITHLHETVRLQRADYLHKVSRWLVEQGRTVVMEGFDVGGLVQHAVPKTMKGKRKRDRRRKILDIAWGDLRFRSEYKAKEHGTDFVVCDTHKATDRPCYRCGAINLMPPTTSVYRCEECGNKTTRQRNTARLLESFGRGNSPESTPGHGETDDVDPKALPPSEARGIQRGKNRETGRKRNGSTSSSGGNLATGGTAPTKKARKPRGRRRRKPPASGTGTSTSQTLSMTASGGPPKGSSST
jgi:IS605 OrfB family transposase